MLESLVIESASKVNASIIWLHGLGANGNDFVPIVEELGIPGLRFILPHAPVRAVTINNGYEMRAWYDIYGLNNNCLQDESGIRSTEQQIAALIAREREQGIPANRIVLAGFSQGGAISLQTGLRHPEPLAGLLALSTYLPLESSLLSERHPANLGLPIFMAHGQFDSVITLATGQSSKALLASAGYPIEWHEYAMAHSVCAEEVEDIRGFLNRVLP
jgi:phospholipase/carboxylesterase